MKWIVSFVISAICLLSSIVFAIIRGKSKYKIGRLLDPIKILSIGVAVSAAILFIPIYLNTFKDSNCGVFETVLISIHNMIRLFIVDGEFSFITSNLVGMSGFIYKGYTVLFSILFVLAPLLTFSFVLSFFKNLSARLRYVLNFKSSIYIFSELNEKSLALATSLYNNSKDRLLVFTDVFERQEESNYEMIERAKELGAICFKKDIASIDFARRKNNKELRFFAIGEDQSENTRQALKIVEKFKYRDNTHLYVFSTQVETEMLLTSAFNVPADKPQDETVKIKVRRINEVQSLIMRTLYDEGFEKIFLGAYENGNVKQINAVVVGMGQHGTEMTKALSWFCQMDGYRVEINSFDIEKNASEKFISLCPELMDAKFNGNYENNGEAQYKITVHSSMDVDTKIFDDTVVSLPRTTYVFVALGNDEKNISVAVKLRALFSRAGYHPQIQAVVYDTDKKEALTDIANYRGQKYDIDFIGDVKSSYSEKVILYSEVEDAALKRHLKWEGASEKEFWQYSYNYRSSIASAIHRKAKELCGISGIEKDPKKRTKEELWAIRILEHRRWNAYMRSEGYIYAGTIEKSGRNDLAKMHNCLVPFAKLPSKEQEKDDD